VKREFSASEEMSRPVPEARASEAKGDARARAPEAGKEGEAAGGEWE
jgi:hypothetical protein